MTADNYNLRMVIYRLSLQHLPLSPGTNPRFPGQLVAGDSFPGRHVARDKWNGKARMGFLPGRHSRATSPGPHSFSQTIKCHGGCGPVLIMVLEKTNAIADWRALIRPTDARKAKVTHPDSIRAMCGQDLERNCVHGSDSHDSAAREISFFFTDAFPGAHLNPVIDIHVSEYIYYEDWYLHATYASDLLSLATAELENERTLAIMKPDGVSCKYISSINKIILESGFTIQRELNVHLDEDSVRSFYAEHSTKSLFPSLVKYMTSGPVLIMVLEKTNAIADWCALIGPTESRKAKVSHPDSLDPPYDSRLRYRLRSSRELEAHYSIMAKIQEVLPGQSSSTEQPLEQVQNHDEDNVFANERRYSEQPESINNTYVLEKDDSNVFPDSSNICTNDNQVDQNAPGCVDERAALANLIANLTLDTEENKTILKQLKKANASLTQEIEECKTNLDETNRALGEATSCRDSCLIALQNKQNELEKYIAFNDRTIDYEILQTKLNDTLDY
ncbi:uncharacterized mitochondrial protein-like protein [Tanacetum coccineum]